MSKLIVNVETGEEIVKDLTKADKDQQKIDEASAVARRAEAQAKETAKQAILDRIGLTADELKTILG
jgi:hypothetical protein